MIIVHAEHCQRRSQFSFLYRTQQTNLNTIPGFSFPIVWLGKIFTNSTKFMWRKGHIGSEFCSQYLHESERRENSFLTDWKIAFPSFWSSVRKFWKKKSDNSITLKYWLCVHSSTTNFIVVFWGMRLVSLSDVSFKLLQKIYFLKNNLESK